MPEGIELTVTAMSKGAGQPDVEELIAAWGDTWYHVIVWPWNDRGSLRTLEAELEDRWGPLRHIDGVAITSKAGTFSELQDFGSGEDKGNYAHISIVEACKTPTLPAVRAAAVAALVAYYGNNDPARPFQTLTMPRPVWPGLLPAWATGPWNHWAALPVRWGKCPFFWAVRPAAWLRLLPPRRNRRRPPSVRPRPWA